MNEGWIKIYRKFSDWEWFNISEMVHLFIYLLINANHQDGEWRGIIVKRGQILTGLNSLNESTKISVQTLRTCLKRLEKTKEINIQSTNKYSIITICKYDDYQSEQQTTNKQTNKQLTFNQQTTNNKQEYKEEKEINTNVFIYSEFYDLQIKLSENNTDYIKFVKYLYGGNDIEKRLNRVLGLKDQLTYTQFEKILTKSIEKKKKLRDMLLDLENNVAYTKGRSNLYSIFNSWLNRN